MAENIIKLYEFYQDDICKLGEFDRDSQTLKLNIDFDLVEFIRNEHEEGNEEYYPYPKLEIKGDSNKQLVGNSADEETFNNALLVFMNTHIKVDGKRIERIGIKTCKEDIPIWFHNDGKELLINCKWDGKGTQTFYMPRPSEITD